jgi:D-mannonate dehydratase
LHRTGIQADRFLLKKVPAAGFTLTPALVSDAVLDFNNVATIKLCYKASRRDSLDTEFDIEPDTLKLFLESLHQRAVAFNWMTTLTIQKNQIHYNLIDGYGTLTFEDVRLHAITYNGQHVHAAQKSMQIFNCLSKSLMEAGKTRVFLESHEYTLNGIADGLLFLKVVVPLAHIDTRATITMICNCLSSLMQKWCTFKTTSCNSTSLSRCNV